LEQVVAEELVEPLEEAEEAAEEALAVLPMLLLP
jgi:hypothetical protein